ncbi:outer membrane beta-barrel family protein [Dyadobacter sp. CY356]|uniref:outer membrane beta-barrel family protein n=1 Tax=Dyadobacter sp. CY356 TaxID=2906442 RepID=UPI001F4472FE|nr:outer membrane beta-barrel family protein [Dyadobacter sp. CY356]MCF0055006.1 TonB-dependent receptor family protein [Dyadobacter sp. CY356]
MEKRYKLCIFLFLCCLQGMAQQSVVTKTSGLIFGFAVDSLLKTPLPFVTVSISDQSSKILTASVTDEKGYFEFANAGEGEMIIRLSFVGYKTLSKSFIITNSAKSFDLGTIRLQQDLIQLKEVAVTGQKASVSLDLDKKIFEVGKDILSQTGSATELLNGVPSVSVGPSGVISLRGNSNVLVLINGRRSGLTQANALEQIPADQIERVEVITNPSSRYDAAGSAGIINIVLKKNKKAGFNGQLRLVGGIPNDNRISPSLNFKSEKVNLFATLGIRYSDYVGLYKTNQVTKDNDVSTFLNQRQDEKRHDDGKLLYVGADYLLNKKNTITAAFLKNATKDHDKTELLYQYASNTKTDSTLLRNGESWEKRDYNQLEFNYTKLFDRKGKKYSVDMQYDFWNSDKDWYLTTKKLLPTEQPPAFIRTGSIGSSKDFLLQTDLIQPLDSNAVLEFGLKVEKRNVTSLFKAEQQIDNRWAIIDNIDNDLIYDELIGSGYVQLKSKVGNLAYQLGMRTEYTRIEIEDRDHIYDRSRSYTRFFPTVHLTYQLTPNATFQGNYSKRINRPSLALLYPFNELTDFNARYVGNPQLNPSYADVFEFGFLKTGNVLTVNPSVYYQNNAGIIQDYTFRNGQGIFITSPVNIDRETRSGVELSVLYNPLKILQLNAELNAYRFKQTGWFQEHDFDYLGNALTSRISAQLKLAHQLGFQFRYNLISAQSNAQRHTAAIQNIDFGISKNLLKNTATVVFDITNLFNLRDFKTTTTGNNYLQTQIIRPNASRYRLTFLYRLNGMGNQAVRQAKRGNRE